ncbi:trigger factor [Egibacter rhizosphaerae]|uniref:Trigger factor n=1 Tax=Egibacter rhizosphaerae TaxID=1670831 RepID=A0A411YBU3_9ACTN|nr:trigger factor [Egibacter rhizosphaerae]
MARRSADRRPERQHRQAARLDPGPSGRPRDGRNRPREPEPARAPGVPGRGPRHRRRRPLGGDSPAHPAAPRAAHQPADRRPRRAGRPRRVRGGHGLPAPRRRLPGLRDGTGHAAPGDREGPDAGRARGCPGRRRHRPRVGDQSVLRVREEVVAPAPGVRRPARATPTRWRPARSGRPLYPAAPPISDFPSARPARPSRARPTARHEAHGQAPRRAGAHPAEEAPVETTVERVDDTNVKLAVTVEAARVDEAVDQAAKELAKEVRVPGFRPGKVPRRVLESRIGKGPLLEQAAQNAVPTFYREAVEAEQLQVLGQPEFEVETFEDGQDAVFNATVEVMPEVEAPDFAGRQIPHPEWEVTEEEVDGQLDELRERFAEVETVERPAQAGDYAVITLSAMKDGEPVEEVAEEDAMYSVRDPEESGEELDRQIIGAQAGDVLEFSDTLGDDYGEELSGSEVDVRVIVKEVKAKQLPAFDDDFAITASEFDTIDELREAVAVQLERQKRNEAREALRGRIVDEIAEGIEVTLPEALVNQEIEFRVSRLGQQAEQYGLELEQYLQLAGISAEQLIEQFREQAQQTVRAQIVVDSVGRQAEMEVDQQDLTEEVNRQAQRMGRDPQELAEFMTEPERIGALYSDAFRRKTIDHILEQVEVINPPPETDEDLDAREPTPDVVEDDADEADTADDVGEADGADTVADDAAADDAAADDAAADDAAEADDTTGDETR